MRQDNAVSRRKAAGAVLAGKPFMAPADTDPAARLCELRAKVEALQAANEVLHSQLAAAQTQSPEESYREVIDASPVPLSVDNMRGSIEYVNRKFVEKFGYRHEELPTSAAWMRLAYPDPKYRRHVSRLWKAFLQEGLRGRREVGPLEVEVTCRDGTKRHVEFVGTRVGHRLLIAANDLTERERLEQQILEIAEQEQERIGQDLHDGLCQLLSGIKFKTTLLEQKLQAKAPEEAGEAGQIESLLNGAIQQARNMAKGLHPVDLEARGLMSALEGLAANVSKLYRIECVCCFRRQVLVHDHILATHLYRIAQEAIANAVKHASARKIRVFLSGNLHQLTLRVEDDGVGLPKMARRPKTGMGLHLMEYRARSIGAHLEFNGARGGGTQVTCRWAAGFQRHSPS